MNAEARALYDEWEREVVAAVRRIPLPACERLADLIESIPVERYTMERLAGQVAILRTLEVAVRTGDRDAAFAVYEEHRP